MRRLPFISRGRDERRRIVVWLLVGLVACQSLLVSMATALGPSHRHEASARIIVLEDVRRAASPSRAPATHVLSALGHFHASESPQRHYHPRTDVSVLLMESGAAMDDDDGAFGAGLSFIALLPPAQLLTAPASSPVPTVGAAWAAITADLDRLERPPRQT